MLAEAAAAALLAQAAHPPVLADAAAAALLARAAPPPMLANAAAAALLAPAALPPMLANAAAVPPFMLAWHSLWLAAVGGCLWPWLVTGPWMYTFVITKQEL